MAVLCSEHNHFNAVKHLKSAGFQNIFTVLNQETKVSFPASEYTIISGKKFLQINVVLTKHIIIS